MSTRIEWANPPDLKGESWNPVTGCSPVSPGCDNCWARAMAHRFPGRFGGRRNPFKVTRHVAKLGLPQRWRKRRCVFVCSMGDLFHDDVSDGVIQNILDVVEECPEHQFLLLTKRPDRMCEILLERYSASPEHGGPATDPADNLAVGVSVEDQQRANERIPLLLQCPAAMRFVSVEPMLGPVDPGFVTTTEHTHHVVHYYADSVEQIHWVIIGCESGPKRRQCKREWVGDLLDQCRAACVPAFVKQMDIDGRVSHDPDEWPWIMGLRQWPKFLQETRR